MGSLLLESERVSLSRPYRNTVARLYSPKLLDRISVEKITYLSDGLRVKGYLARPLNPGRYPVLIWNRGGFGDDGAITELTAHLILGSTADWGYVVLGTQYRGNMDSEGEEDWAGEDVRDAQKLIEVAEEIPQADTERIAVEGASRGGMTTYRMLRDDHRFRCGIVHAGLADIPQLCEERPRFRNFMSERLRQLSEEERRERLRQVSAVHFADRFSPDIPLLVMHGDKDHTVPIDQSESLVEKLREYNLPHSFRVISGGGHVALKDGSYREIDQLRRDWLATYLTPLQK